MASYKLKTEYTIWVFDEMFGGERVFEKTWYKERKDEICQILCDSGKSVAVTECKKRCYA